MLGDLISPYINAALIKLHEFLQQHDISIAAFYECLAIAACFIPCALILSDYKKSLKQENPLSYYRDTVRTAAITRSNVTSFLMFPALVMLLLVFFKGESMDFVHEPGKEAFFVMIYLWPIGYFAHIILYLVLLVGLSAVELKKSNSAVVRDSEAFKISKIISDIWYMSWLVVFFFGAFGAVLLLIELSI